jgi:DNA-binding NarL/FixJ family response regulator
MKNSESATRAVRVVIADDDLMVLDQLCVLLEDHFDIVGRAQNGRELVDAVQKLSPEIVVADVTMPEMNGIEATQKIKATISGVKVVMLSVHDHSVFVEAAFEAGASAYVLKIRAAEDLLSAMEAVLDGREYRSRGLG